jgi:hypothetical protein
MTDPPATPGSTALVTGVTRPCSEKLSETLVGA